METKAITPMFTERGKTLTPAEKINRQLHEIERLFEECERELIQMEMGSCGYESQSNAIDTMTENMEQLSLYAQTAHEYVSEKLDRPLYRHFKENATETITSIKINEITTDNIIGLADYVDIKKQGRELRYKRVRENLTLEDFLGIRKNGMGNRTPIKESAKQLEEFTSLFHMDYDKMSNKECGLEEYLEWYITPGSTQQKAAPTIKENPDKSDAKETETTTNNTQEKSLNEAQTWQEWLDLGVDNLMDTKVGDALAELEKAVYMNAPYSSEICRLYIMISGKDREEAEKDILEFSRGSAGGTLKIAGEAFFGALTIGETIENLTGMCNKYGVKESIKILGAGVLEGIEKTWEEEILNGDARSRGEMFTRLEAEILLSIAGAKAAGALKGSKDVIPDIPDGVLKGCKEGIEGGLKSGKSIGTVWDNI